MLFRDRIKPIRDHQIEQILLRAHVESDAGLDLIEEYFNTQSSLDFVTQRAHELLQEHEDPEVVESIVKNLSECIVVKNICESQSLFGNVKKALSKVGIQLGKNREILRAERLIHKITTTQKEK